MSDNTINLVAKVIRNFLFFGAGFATITLLRYSGIL